MGAGASSDTTSVSYGHQRSDVVTREGVTTSYARTVSGSTGTTVVTNALGQQTHRRFRSQYRPPTSMTDGLGRTTSFTTDTNGRLTKLPSLSAIMSTTYDARGQATQTVQVARPGSGDASIVPRRVTLPAVPTSRPVISKTPHGGRGNVTDYTYASHGRLAERERTSPSETG